MDDGDGWVREILYKVAELVSLIVPLFEPFVPVRALNRAALHRHTNRLLRPCQVGPARHLRARSGITWHGHRSIFFVIATCACRFSAGLRCHGQWKRVNFMQLRSGCERHPETIHDQSSWAEGTAYTASRTGGAGVHLLVVAGAGGVLECKSANVSWLWSSCTIWWGSCLLLASEGRLAWTGPCSRGVWPTKQMISFANTSAIHGLASHANVFRLWQGMMPFCLRIGGFNVWHPFRCSTRGPSTTYVGLKTWGV